MREKITWAFVCITFGLMIGLTISISLFHKEEMKAIHSLQDSITVLHKEIRNLNHK